MTSRSRVAREDATNPARRQTQIRRFLPAAVGPASDCRTVGDSTAGGSGSLPDYSHRAFPVRLKPENRSQRTDIGFSQKPEFN